MSSSKTARKSACKSACKPAFTLVELLIVIVIIGVLAALMFPMIRSMRTRAEITKCTANLKLWGFVFQSYANEHNQMVRYRDWEDIGSTTKIYKTYFSSEDVWWPEQKKMGASQGLYRQCPAQKWSGVGNPLAGYLVVRGNELNSSGKYAKVTVDTDPTDNYNDDSYYLSKMERPAQFLMMMDSNTPKSIYRTSEFTDYVKPICINDDKAKIRHGGGVNGLFGDGHVEFLKWSEIDPDNPANTAKVTTWLNFN